MKRLLLGGGVCGLLALASSGIPAGATHAGTSQYLQYSNTDQSADSTQSASSDQTADASTGGNNNTCTAGDLSVGACALQTNAPVFSDQNSTAGNTSDNLNAADLGNFNGTGQSIQQGASSGHPPRTSKLTQGANTNQQGSSSQGASSTQGASASTGGNSNTCSSGTLSVGACLVQTNAPVFSPETASASNGSTNTNLGSVVNVNEAVQSIGP